MKNIEGCDWSGSNFEFSGHLLKDHEKHVIKGENNIFKVKTSLGLRFNVKILSDDYQSCLLKTSIVDNKFYYALNPLEKNEENAEYSVAHKSIQTPNHSALKTVGTLTKLNGFYDEQNLNKNPNATVVDIDSLKHLADKDNVISNEFNLNPKGIDEDVLKLLECPVCLSTMRPPIYQCNRGHSICIVCRKEVGVCPTCNDKWTNVRNFFMENFTTNVKYPCRFKKSGCKEIGVESQIKKHEEICLLNSNKSVSNKIVIKEQTIKCMEKDLIRGCRFDCFGCKERGVESEIIKHEKSCEFCYYKCPMCPQFVHKDNIVKHVYNSHDIRETNTLRVISRFISQVDYIIFDSNLFKISCQDDDGYIYFDVELICSNEEPSMYCFVITFSKNTGRPLILESSCSKERKLGSDIKGNVKIPADEYNYFDVSILFGIGYSHGEITNKTMNQFTDNLVKEKIFHCQICDELCTSDIFLVKGKGNVCGKCLEEKFGEEMKSKAELIRPLMSIMAKLMLPCKFQSKGCNERVESKNYFKHIGSCNKISTKELTIKSMGEGEMSNETFTDNLLREKIFHCKICDELCTSDIFLVKGKGNVCGKCLEEKCGEDIKSKAELITPLMSIMAKLMLPCKFQSKGCDKRVESKNYSKHIGSCDFKIKQCPMKNVEDCDWSGSNFEISGHLLKNHHDHVIKGENNIFKVETSIGEPFNVKILSDDYQSCLLKTSVVDNKFYYSLNPLEKSEESMEYSVVHRSIETPNPLVKTVGTFTKLNGFYDEQNLNINPNATVVDIDLLKHIADENDMISNEFNLNPKGLDEDMLKLLECPICMSTMRPPIYQCNRGHSICIICREEVSECPTCEDKWSNVRNFFMEHFTTNVKYPCKFKKYGCKEIGVESEIKKHEENCFLNTFVVAATALKGIKATFERN
ncbi:unnamed protein product [Brassicogethes aeneus]|uniref:RING-type E3 ubiquitin transferase n=1 Tax=Brassicogethes aeneus TaxID=1431903 RepID=A0A9P0FBJ3_BRAAE|nr:unnamed protein product [Brassicogethes aeneus]